MRKPPTAELETPPLVSPVARPDIITQRREYELITPLFGGGVEPGYADPVTIVRGTEVRGHLRFWWRATRGGRFDSLGAMKEAEDLLWGAPSRPDAPLHSKVQVFVSVVNRGEDKPPFEVVKKLKKDGSVDLDDRGRPKSQLQPNVNVAPAYAAFPLQPNQQEMRNIGWKSKPLRDRVSFALTLTYPTSDAEEVEAALWAWENFGGIGGRTRRGFGALSLLRAQVAPSKISLPDADCDKIRQYIADELYESSYISEGDWPAAVPRLDPEAEFEITEIKPTALEAWQELVAVLRDFRQQRNPGRGPTPGRSKWPEPEYIRDRTGQRLPRHQVGSLIRKFPRAAFGLPIIFQFKDRNKNNSLDSSSDPRTTMLTVDGYERHASPLLLRPLRLADRKYIGLALILDGTGEASQLKLALQDSGLDDRLKRSSNLPLSGLRADLDPNEAAAINRSDGRTPLLGTNTNVLYAFLDFLKSRRRRS
ncbi:MAG: type III-B CRISPR module RAMP protein Cmr1 [Acidobacteria bacterium]|nr:type III-B CRISPR module RAMP protein Cmr1 [Acidobacteriota bacterium]